MKLSGKKTLNDFKQERPDSRSKVESWEAEVKAAQWNTPHEVKARYPRASILKNRNAIFDICGSRYRLWVLISYKNKIVFVRKIGTHKEYENWDLG